MVTEKLEYRGWKLVHEQGLAPGDTRKVGLGFKKEITVSRPGKRPVSFFFGPFFVTGKHFDDACKTAKKHIDIFEKALPENIEKILNTFQSSDSGDNDIRFIAAEK